MKHVAPRSVKATLLLLSTIAAALARSFYLSPDGADEPSRGSVTQPWQTITYATGRMQAGDTLLLAPGTYSSEARIDIRNGGSAAAPMVIRARNTPRPVINLGYISPVSTLPSASPDDTLRLAAGQPAKPDGPADQNRAIHVNVNHVVFEELIIEGAHTAIWAAGWNGRLQGLIIRGCLIRYHERYALRLDYYDDVRMEHCDVYHCGLVNWPRGSSGWPHAIIGWNSRQVTIEQCRVHDNHGEGVGPFQGCSFWEIRGCEVYDNWSVNIYIDIDESDAIVDGNLVYNTGKYGATGRNNPDGIRIANEIADMDYSEWGISLDPTPEVDNIVVTNNIIVATGGGIRAFPYAPYQRFVLRNSLIAHNTIVDIAAEYNGIQVTGEQVEVANNLLVNCAAPTWFVRIGSGINDHHNVIVDNGGFTGGAQYQADSYRLLASSPAVDAGGPLSQVSVDYWGTPRPQGVACDAGAHEYAAVPIGTHRPARRAPQVQTRLQRFNLRGCAVEPDASCGAGFSAAPGNARMRVK